MKRMFVCFFLVDSTCENPMESSRIWMDDAEGLSLPQFRREWRLVGLCEIVDFVCVLDVFYVYLIVFIGMVFAVRAVVFVFRRDVQFMHPEVKPLFIIKCFLNLLIL